MQNPCFQIAATPVAKHLPPNRRKYRRTTAANTCRNSVATSAAKLPESLNKNFRTLTLAIK